MLRSIWMHAWDLEGINHQELISFLKDWVKPNNDTAGESPLRGDLSRGRLERGEGRNARFCQRDFGQPFRNPKQIERHRRQNLLEMCFD
jgi:hypothetical protein